ncbi:hypothetical protein [Pedosphaera parvula]|uniref:Uncharacterized protein n=1 Tax=Pedosphaera parvula (strain Ellin514) TaxID=320771 RepID=B9XK27_PEDPL|nr:hypothetical protein [Pedosphaera parvula]EEF59850.1 hypothetical protein Cflav_PD2857 [Pedosphaera parvula Ellin514]
MGWFKKKADPINERARALNEQIAALESQIKRLSTHVEKSEELEESTSKTRSAAGPADQSSASIAKPGAPQPTPGEPVFEEVNQNRLKSQGEPETTSEHYNELGVRKYDLAALLRRIKNHFRGPSTANPKLVSYLAAGSIQGLRPMRYEKRVARNRFLFFFILLFLGLLGIIVMFVKNH